MSSFRCEFNANVTPAAEVEVVQASILSLLNSTFSYDFLNLTAYPNSISILPVGTYRLRTKCTLCYVLVDYCTSQTLTHILWPFL